MTNIFVREFIIHILLTIQNSHIYHSRSTYSYVWNYRILLSKFLQCFFITSLVYLFLSFLFISSYYLGHRFFSLYYSGSGNWNCGNGFLLIVCTVHVTKLLRKQNCILRKDNLLRRCIRRRWMLKRYAKHSLLFLSFYYLVVWATMMQNEYFMVIIYSFWAKVFRFHVESLSKRDSNPRSRASTISISRVIYWLEK